MTSQSSTDNNLGSETATYGFPDEGGRRIRWERHPDDSALIVILDAVTGAVIAVVRSLFDIETWAH